MPAATPPAGPTGTERGGPPRRLWLKLAASALICYHLCAIAIAPASMPPASTTVQSLFRVFRPYLQAAYLNHGYHYFAPEPGPSSLIEFTVVSPAGDRHWLRMPDRRKTWPRLLYHRRFMLTEFYGGIPPAAKQLRQAVAAAFAHRALKEFGGSSVEMSHVIHNLSSRQDVLAGQSLLHDDKYDVTPLGRFTLAPDREQP